MRVTDSGRIPDPQIDNNVLKQWKDAPIDFEGQATYYVQPGGSGDGTFGSPFGSVEAAIATVGAGHEFLHVAGG